jgi:hypothetical protein
MLVGHLLLQFVQEQTFGLPFPLPICTVQSPMSAGAAPRPASSKQNINFFIDSSFLE